MSDPVDQINERINQIAELKDGWFDDDGIAFDKTYLDWVRDKLIEIVERKAVLHPRIYPTTGGEIQAEWASSKWDITVVFERDANTFRVEITDLIHTNDKEFKWNSGIDMIVTTIIEYMGLYNYDA